MRIIYFVSFVFAFVLSVDAHAQQFPNRPITLVVGFAAGGNIDVTARAVGQSMSKALSQRVIVENRPGAGGVVGQAYVARSDPDGYTIGLVGSPGVFLAPKLVKSVAYTVQDLTGIGSATAVPMAFLVNSSSKFASFEELIRYAKANPRSVRVGHAGNGTTNQIAILRLQQALEVEFTVVPYRGSAMAVTDLLGNFIDAITDQIPSSLSHIQSGAFRPLAIVGPKRAIDMPNVPTLEELGLKGIDGTTTSGLIAPVKTPAPVIAILHDALTKALDDPDVQKQLRVLGSSVVKQTPEAYNDLLKQDDATADKLLKEGLVTVE